ncbi:MAG TPA: hypothetical protein VI357_26840 [Mycobacteriales bacterium]
MSSLLLLASAAPAAAPAAENREASPIALVLVLVLLVALIFLIRSMNKHLRKVPTSFSEPEHPASTPAEHDAVPGPDSDR